MLLTTLCAPSILVVVFTLIIIILDMNENQYKIALVKLVCSILIICLLEILCSSQLYILSWLIVFMPLIIYTYTTYIIFFVFGLDPTSKLKKYEVKSSN